MSSFRFWASAVCPIEAKRKRSEHQIYSSTQPNQTKDLSVEEAKPIAKSAAEKFYNLFDSKPKMQGRKRDPPVKTFSDILLDSTCSKCVHNNRCDAYGPCDKVGEAIDPDKPKTDSWRTPLSQNFKINTLTTPPSIGPTGNTFNHTDIVHKGVDYTLHLCQQHHKRLQRLFDSKGSGEQTSAQSKKNPMQVDLGGSLVTLSRGKNKPDSSTSSVTRDTVPESGKVLRTFDFKMEELKSIINSAIASLGDRWDDEKYEAGLQILESSKNFITKYQNTQNTNRPAAAAAAAATAAPSPVAAAAAAAAAAATAAPSPVAAAAAADEDEWVEEGAASPTAAAATGE
jgi:hypothetical protein